MRLYLALAMALLSEGCGVNHLSNFTEAARSAVTVPGEAAGAGFNRLLFDEEFNTRDIAPSASSTARHNWYPGLWWESNVPLASQTAVNSGILDLAWTRSRWTTTGLCDATIESESKSGVIGTSFRYGYVEARMKWDNVKGAWPALWMLPVEGMRGYTRTAEIDIFEGQGLDSTYYGTLHTWNRATPTWASSPNAFRIPAGADFSQWHTYGLLWIPPAGGKPGKVTWYFDHGAVGSAHTTESAGSLFDQQDFFLVVSSQEGVDWKSCAPLTDGSPSSIHLHVDWVHVFGK